MEWEGGEAVAELDMMYEEYANPVYRYLCSLCHDPDLAEELTQETFYRAMKSIGSFNGQCKLVVWLCAIGKHLWYQELQRRKRKPTVPVETLPEAGEIPKEFQGDENRVALFRAMQRLEETVREVIYLRVMGDLKFSQIGDVLGKSENWARVTFYRGKEKLRKELEKHEQ